MRFVSGSLRAIARTVQMTIASALALVLIWCAVVWADYTIKDASGTTQTFASKIISSVHYAAHLLCDPTAGDGQCAAVDGSGRLSVSINGGTAVNDNGPVTASGSSPVTLPVLNHASTTALGTSLVAKNAPANLNGFNCTAITGGAAGFCIAYNATAAPSTGALTGALVLDYCYFDTTARGCSLAHANGSIAFSAGIVILVTTAASPYTYTTGLDTAAVEADYD